MEKMSGLASATPEFIARRAEMGLPLNMQDDGVLMPTTTPTWSSASSRRECYSYLRKNGSRDYIIMNPAGSTCEADK